MNVILERLSSDRLIILVCFILSIFLWISSQLSKTINHRIALNVEYLSPKSMALATALPSTLEFDITGTGWVFLFSSLKNNSKWELQLPNEKEVVLSESDIYKMINRDFQLEGLELSGLYPQHIFIKQDSLIQKSVPLDAKVEIQPLEGYVISSNYSFEPSNVNLSGPEEMLSKLDYWSLGKLKLSQKKNELELSETITIDAGNPLLQVEPKEIEVFVEFEELTEKSFQIPIQVDTSIKKIDRIFPKVIKLTARLGLSKFNHINASDFELGIELDSINVSNTYVVKIVKAPKDIKILDLSPSYVDIYFKDE